MTDSNYAEPVSQLLMLGDCREEHEWRDYGTLGVGPGQVPDLIRMVDDDELHEADWESTEIWAPIHAWRALGQLRAEAAVEELLGILWRIDDGNDWVGEEVPVVLGMIGPVAVPKIAEYLDEPLHGVWPRSAAAHALAEISQRHPAARDDCVAVLSSSLQDYAVHHPALNAFLMSYLVDLKAVESAPVMEEAFAADRVDISVQGDWEDVQILLGLLDERLTPAPNYHQLPEPWLPDPWLPEPLVPRKQTTSKEQWKGEQAAERRRQDKRRAKRKKKKKARKKQRKRK